MQKVILYALKALKSAKINVMLPLDWLITYFIFYANGVRFTKFRSYGSPLMNVGIGSKCMIGYNFRINNREMSNPIGRFNRCSLIVSRNGELIIGDHVGMSSTSIVCHHKIYIGNYVKFGGNVVIYDTDFHSLNYKERQIYEVDMAAARTAPVKIGDNAFIGAHTTILKGVEIGENAIIGACSVVTKNIPANEIWAGNPAKKVRAIQEHYCNGALPLAI